MNDLTKNVETRIAMKKFTFRDYQIPIVNAVERDNFKKIFICLGRRAGKDLTCLQIALRQCLKKACTVFYIFPTFSNARKAIWDAIDNSGIKILDYLPDAICKKNSSEMKVTFINGSVIQFLGSSEYDRLRGTNPYMVIFSEYAYQNPMAYTTIRPVLASNDGVAIFISTPFSKNHFYDLYQVASNSPAWFCYRKNVDETMHLSQEKLEEERASMSHDMFMQEYYVSFDQGVRGSVFATVMNQINNNNQITNVPWEPSFQVHTSWDLGYADKTVIIFFQICGQSIHIIDYYENNQHGLEHYIKFLDTKPYKYGKHIAPHDMENHSFSTGVSRRDMASRLGVSFIISPKLHVSDGVEAAKVALAKCYIDEDKCSCLVKNLNLYRYVWDEKRQDYTNKFCHMDSHAADAFRYLAVSYKKAVTGTSPEELNSRYNRAMYGTDRGNFNPLG